MIAFSPPGTTVTSASGESIFITGVVSPGFATAALNVSDPTDAVLAALDGAGQVDRTVVLGYLPVDELRSLAESLPEADAVIGGPTGQALPAEKVGHALVLSATNKGKFLAEVVFSTDGSTSGSVVEMSADLTDHRVQKSNLDTFRKFLAERDFRADESGFVPPALSADGQTIAGDKSCAQCHSETVDHWHTTAHAHAWQRLQDEGAHVDSYCQQCHTTGFGLPEGFVSAKLSAHRTNVGCESCHGPSSAHAADSNQKTPFDARGICRRCHDVENSPKFEFDSYWETVRHE